MSLTNISLQVPQIFITVFLLTPSWANHIHTLFAKELTPVFSYLCLKTWKIQDILH